MMLRGGISSKVFALLMAVFIVFITAALYLQTAFFENFYTSRKSETLDQRMEGFSSLYSSADWSQRDLRINTNAFERANGVRMAIVDASINLINDDKYTLLMKDYSGVEIILELNAALTESEFSQIRDIEPGEEVRAEGFLLGEPDALHMTPVRMVIGGTVIVDHKSVYGYEGASDTIDRVAGKILSSDLPGEEEIIRGIEDQTLWSVVDYWNRQYNMNQSPQQKNVFYKTEAEHMEQQQFVFSDPLTRERYLTRVYSIPKGGEIHYAFVVASQLPILEAVETLSAYYAVIVLAAVLMSVVLSYFVSRIVTRPLLRINVIAGRMAKLDFSDYIEVRTEDEIGHLSQSLNTLSMNLQGSMEELKRTNDRLQMEIEKERRLEVMRREFISGASHELKTPIGIIKGFSEGIRDGLAKDRLAYFIEVILEETDKMDALVRDMLSLSRIEQDPGGLQMEEFEGVDFVTGICEKLAPQFEENGKSLRIEGALERVTLQADRRRMEQVLINGLTNALRYSREDSKTVVQLQDHAAHVRVSVINEGDPIPQEHLEHVWDRFYRVDPSRNKSRGGSGLGLSIVREILSQHGVAYGILNLDDGVMFYFDIHKDTCDEKRVR